MGKQVTATSKNAKVPSELVDIGMTSEQYYEFKIYIKSIVVPGTDGFECKSLGNSENKQIYRKWLDNTLEDIGPRFFPEGANDLVWPEDYEEVVHKVVRVLSIGLRLKHKKGRLRAARESGDNDETEIIWDDGFSGDGDIEDNGSTDGHDDDSDASGQEDDTNGQEDDTGVQKNDTDGQENDTNGQEEGTDEQEDGTDVQEDSADKREDSTDREGEDTVPNEGEACAQWEHKKAERKEENTMAFMVVISQESNLKNNNTKERGLEDDTDRQEDDTDGQENDTDGQEDSTNGQPEKDGADEQEDDTERQEDDTDGQEDGTDGQKAGTDRKKEGTDGQEEGTDGQGDDSIPNDSEGEVCAQQEHEEYKAENTRAFEVMIGQDSGDDDTMEEEQEASTNGQEDSTNSQGDNTISNEDEACIQWEPEHKESKEDNMMTFMVAMDQPEGSEDDNTIEEELEEQLEEWLDAVPIELEDLLSLMKPERPAYFPDLTDKDFDTF